MKAEEFIIWLRGFIAGSNHYNLTPAGWDRLKKELSKVDFNDDNSQDEDVIDDIFD